MFLADANPQVRQLAMSSIVSFSGKNNPNRRLLIDPLKDAHGKPVCTPKGEPLDVIEQLKKLCNDQPLTVHDALSALINRLIQRLSRRVLATKSSWPFL